LTIAASAKVTVVGGGTAGLTAAIRLALGGVDTVQLFRGGRPVNRGESLSPAATSILADLGLWDRFMADRHIPCFVNKSVWGSSEVQIYDFINHPAGHAWHIDRPLFETRLAERAAEVGVRRIEVSRRVCIGRHKGGWRVDLGNRDCVNTDLLIDASGRAAVIACRFGAKWIRYDRQIAIVATLVGTPNRNGDANTLVEAAEAGWWYSAPIPGGNLATAFFTDPDLVCRSEIGTPAGWARLMSDSPHTSRRVVTGRYHLECPTRFAAAGSACLDRFFGGGWLAAGDAALSLDPISSHGITLALASGRDAADAVLKLERGDREALNRYAARLERACADYLAMRQWIYRSDRRWPRSPYWSRRQQTSYVVNSGVSDEGIQVTRPRCFRDFGENHL
jgi:flavin-dependent dehydrogenase